MGRHSYPSENYFQLRCLDRNIEEQRRAWRIGAGVRFPFDQPFFGGKAEEALLGEALNGYSQGQVGVAIAGSVVAAAVKSDSDGIRVSLDVQVNLATRLAIRAQRSHRRRPDLALIPQGGNVPNNTPEFVLEDFTRVGGMKP